MACCASRRVHGQGTSVRLLRRGTAVFVGPGGTIGWLATADGAVLVDSQFPETAVTCLAAVRRRTTAPIAVLINTHHHADHTAGNVTCRPAVKQIVQHERCAASHRTIAKAGLADVTFATTWSTTIGDERVTARHFGAAHTGGDAIVVFERANVVHAGDLVFNRIPPFVDRAAGASIRNWITVLETVAAEHADALYVFGHGRNENVTGTVDDVRHFRDYLTAVLEHVQRAVAAGRSVEETARLAAVPGFPDFPDLVKNYASAFPLFTLGHVLTAAYQELTAGR
jgi:glyoxylase-like metal-dependent hydrolase (beta-lactamase superfamily II)